MKKRIDLICAVYMALILCLVGVGGFVVYQQEQVIEEQRQYIQDLLEREPAVVVQYVQLPPEIIVETIYIDKPVYEIVERVIIEEKEVEVEVIVYHYFPIRNWESVEEFEEWYEAQDFRILMPSPAYTVDCDDYSKGLQRAAARQGYLVSEAISKNHLYAGVWVTKINGLHAGNLVLIGNDYYWVEPQPDMFNIKQLFERD